MYLIPFSASFKDTLRTGNNFGKRSMTSQERLIYSPASSPALNTAPVSATNDPPTNHTRGGTPTNAIVNVLSYSYGHIVCNRGKAHVSMVSTDEKSCGKSW